MHSDTGFLLTIVVLCYAVVSGVVRRWYVAPALIFVVIGIALGPSTLGLTEDGRGAEGFIVLAQLALTVILFNQASMLDLRHVFSRGHLTVRLLAIGIPTTIALGTLTAVLLLPVLPLWEAACLAVIVAPTEVALIDALLEDQRIPEHLRGVLSAETGLYDGIALAALLATLAIASEQVDHAVGHWVWFVLRTEFVSVAVGIAIGLFGAAVISRSRQRGWMSDTWAQLATLALALVCFGVGERLHASGFVAAFAGGLAYALLSPKSGEMVEGTQVSAAAAQLLELLVFALFGAFTVIPAWREADWRVVVFAVVAVFGVRLVAVAVALIGSGEPMSNTAFIAWFGPRGIGTLVLGLLVVEEGNIVHESVLAQVVVVSVTLSLLVHSITAPVGIRLIARPEPPADTRSPSVADTA
jgi:NhaP-type Na+/H+ or K+/H+ antiporter